MGSETVMVSRALPEDILAEEPHLLGTLREKRELLDREVAEFKALKDEEYRRFELSIQAVGRIYDSESRNSDDIQDGRHIRQNEDIQRGRMESRRRSDEKFPAGSMQERLRTENKAEIKRTDNNDAGVVPGGTNSLMPETLSHEREIEFRGLFTPTYMPLLENSRRPNGENASKSLSPPLHSLAGLASERKEHLASLSSSATLPATIYNPLHSPTIPSKLSNSAPRPRLLDERRSSSKSDISITSLRSSLRQAKSPRSPKHVLFAIDNTFLSPSTSPLVHRAAQHPPIPFSGLTDMPKHATEQAEVPVQLNGTMHGNGNVVPNLDSAIKPSTSASSSLTRSYHQLLEPTVSSTRDDLEDFEDVGQDEVLFSFDEDVDLRDDSSTGDEKESGSEIDEGEASNMPINSPHAGSLPIEIRWPARSSRT